MELLILLKMLFFVETVFPEKTSITIYLMFLFAINTFERMRAQFAFFILESKGVSLEIYLTAPYYLFIVINFKRSVAFDTFKTMIHKSHIILFPAILTLWDTQIHICFSNSCNIMFNIKTSIDKVFCFGTTLRVLDVDPNYCYVRFGRSINNSKIEDKGNIFKYVSIFITISIISIVIERLVFLIK